MTHRELLDLLKTAHDDSALDNAPQAKTALASLAMAIKTALGDEPGPKKAA